MRSVDAAGNRSQPVHRCATQPWPVAKLRGSAWDHSTMYFKAHNAKVSKQQTAWGGDVIRLTGKQWIAEMIDQSPRDFGFSPLLAPAVSPSS